MGNTTKEEIPPSEVVTDDDFEREYFQSLSDGKPARYTYDNESTTSMATNEW